MFVDQARTPYDIQFHLGSIPVRISPWFWVISVLFGIRLLDDGIEYLLAWVACVFVSILLHELGHVWMGMAFGTRGEILLWGFGGLAIGASNLDSRGQRILVSLAGPGIQLVLWGVVKLIGAQVVLTSPLQLAIFQFLIFINLYWALVNLAPVWPLDGGQVARDVLVGQNRQDGLRWSLMLSVGTCVALAIFFAWMTRDWYPVILFGLLGVQSFQMLQQLPPRGQSRERWSNQAAHEEQQREPWEQDPDYWKK